MTDLLAGRYRRVRPLGRGAMGEVWLATDELLHRTVAVKTVLAGPADGAADAPDAGLTERVVREARLAAGLNHPHTVAVHDLVVEDGRPHVVMEYVAGRTLADEIRDRGPLPAERVRGIGIALAGALAEAHARGIVHRDVKPANVLLTERGVPKLADFGIARSAATSTTGAMLGTPAYIAPEVVEGGRAGPPGDVWSLGVTLYAALAGRSPFQRSADESVFAVLHRIAGVGTDPVPLPPGDPATAAAVMTLLRRDPATRPDAAGVATALAGADPAVPRAGSGTAGPAGSSAEVTGVLPRPPRRRRWAPALIAAAAAVAVVAGAVTAVMLSRTDDEHPAAAPTGGASRSVAAPTTAPGTGDRASSASASGTSSAVLDTYTAPGGISVRGPAGWIRDDGAGIVNVRDYRAPGSTDRATGAYFRIGIANTRPADTIEDEAQGTRKYLLTGTDARILASSITTFRDRDAVRQEYTRTNSSGVPRRLLILLFFHAGQTLEIEYDAPAADFARTRAIFDQLVAGCRVT